MLVIIAEHGLYLGNLNEIFLECHELVEGSLKKTHIKVGVAECVRKGPEK